MGGHDHHLRGRIVVYQRVLVLGPLKGDQILDAKFGTQVLQSFQFSADLFGTRSHGMIFGVVISITAVGGAIGPVIAGYMFDMTNSYQIHFLVVTGMSITGLIATTLLKPIHRDSDS